MNLKNKNILLVGLAKTGVSTIKLLNKLEANIIVNDIKDKEKLKDILEELESPQEANKKSNVKCTMGMRIYLNTMKQAFDTIIDTGIEAKYNEVDKGDYMEVVVRIPKK